MPKAVFQDLVKDGDAAEVFFELANERRVSYRAPSGALVTVEQDPDVANSTGGIVWLVFFILE